MANFKVVYRVDMKTKGEGGLAWKPGCPVAFRAIQVSRNVNTADAFLQAEVRNVSREEIGSFKARFGVSSEPVVMPRPKLLGLSDEAVAECSEEVWGSPEAVKYARRGLEEHDGWWLCPCGRLNVGRDGCSACGASLDKLSESTLEDGGALDVVCQ